MNGPRRPESFASGLFVRSIEAKVMNGNEDAASERLANVINIAPDQAPMVFLLAGSSTNPGVRILVAETVGIVLDLPDSTDASTERTALLLARLYHDSDPQVAEAARLTFKEYDRDDGDKLAAVYAALSRVAQDQAL